MAKEYIDREAAIKVLKDHKICFEHDFGWNKSVLDALDTAIEALAADVAPVRHGRWVHPAPGDGEPYCSACHAEAEYFYGYGSFEPDYCPNCGADMREEYADV